MIALFSLLNHWVRTCLATVSIQIQSPSINVMLTWDRPFSVTSHLVTTCVNITLAIHFSNQVFVLFIAVHSTSDNDMKSVLPSTIHTKFTSHMIALVFVCNEGDVMLPHFSRRASGLMSLPYTVVTLWIELVPVKYSRFLLQITWPNCSRTRILTISPLTCNFRDLLIWIT